MAKYVVTYHWSPSRYTVSADSEEEALEIADRQYIREWERGDAPSDDYLEEITVEKIQRKPASKSRKVRS